MPCRRMEASRLSQKICPQAGNAGATTPTAAPAMVNWLYFLAIRFHGCRIRICPSTRRSAPGCAGRCRTGAWPCNPSRSSLPLRAGRGQRRQPPRRRVAGNPGAPGPAGSTVRSFGSGSRPRQRHRTYLEPSVKDVTESFGGTRAAHVNQATGCSFCRHDKHNRSAVATGSVPTKRFHSSANRCRLEGSTHARRAFAHSTSMEWVR